MLVAFGEEAARRLRRAVASGALRGTLVKPEPAPVAPAAPAPDAVAPVEALQQVRSQPRRTRAAGHSGRSHFPVTFLDFGAGAKTPAMPWETKKKSPSTKLGLKFREETSKKGNKGKGQKTFRLLQCNN